VVVGHPHEPAAPRGAPADSDVAADADKRTARARPCGAARRTIRRPRFGSRSQVDAHSCRDANSAGVAIHVHLLPCRPHASGDRHGRGRLEPTRRLLAPTRRRLAPTRRWLAPTRGKRVPVAVVAGELERPADSRIDVAAREPGRAEGDLERVDQQRVHADRPA